MSSNNIVPNYHRYQEEVQTNTYNDEDENEDGNVDSSNTPITTIIPSTSNEENSQSDNTVGLYDDLNTNETDILDSTRRRRLFDDNDTISTVDLTATNNATEVVDENKTNNEAEDGEIIENDGSSPHPNIQELQNLSTQVRGLLNDDNILVIDGRQRLLSLLSQIDNLHPA